MDDRIVTFPWGIDLRHFTPRPSALSLRRDLGWTDNPIVISTRTWEPTYAIDVLVRAFGLVRKRHPEARLLLLGDGSQGPMIHSLISELNLTDIVYAPGRITYELLPDYFCLADIYVSSALSDGTSVSMLEAMACGLPVVVTNAYGNLEWVKPGENGWLVAPGDAVVLADALNEALADPLRVTNIKRANIELTRIRADWNKNFLQLLELLECVATPALVLNHDTHTSPTE
jgi:glycosyltransferase involved in cell wall biosynthesis